MSKLGEFRCNARSIDGSKQSTQVYTERRFMHSRYPVGSTVQDRSGLPGCVNVASLPLIQNV